MTRWQPLCAIALVAACGGAAERPPAIAIPDQPATDAGAPIATPEARTPAPTAANPPLPASANGPRDAKGVLGDLGDAAAGLSPFLLVNTGEMRAHPKGPALGKLVVTAMVGWTKFLPVDLIDPVKDTDWVVMVGDIHLGSTSKNVILARYNVDEKRADVVSKELEKRLRGKPADFGSGTKSLTAVVDGAPRAYIRGKPGTLAIVPVSEAQRIAPLVMRVEIPRSVRKNELLRFAAADRNAIRMFEIPEDLRSFRVWVETEGERLFLHAEGDTADGETAIKAASELRAMLDRYGGRMPFGIILKGLLSLATVWTDGPVVRYRGEIEEGLLAAAALMGGSSP